MDAVDGQGLQGAMVKAPVANALLEVYRIDDAGFAIGEPVASTSTDGSGNFELNPVPSGGPFIIRSIGGVFRDESDQTGQRVIDFGDSGLEVFLPVGESTVAITPLSAALLQKIRAEAGGANFLSRVQGNRAVFLQALGFDVISVIPPSPIAPDAANRTPAELDYAMILGGFAQSLNALATGLGLENPTPALILALIDDLSDGSIDGRRFGSSIPLPGVPGGLLPQGNIVNLNAKINLFRNNNDGQYRGLTPPVVNFPALQQPGEIDPSLIPTPTPSTVPTVSPTGSPTPSLSPTPSASPTGSPTPAPTATAGPTAPPTATPPVVVGPTATDVPVPTVLPTSTPTVTATPTPTATATPTPTAAPTNAPPVAQNDSAQVLEDQSAVLDLLSNDSDPENQTLSISALGTPNAGGTVELLDGDVVYTPALDYNGSESFSYTVADSEGATASATATVNVIAVNDAPSFTPGADVLVDEDAGPQTVNWATEVSAGPSNESSQGLSFSL
ncbi:MAG: cadherin-like domain-containing protein, partial [Oceanococcaceae bacterium]